MKYSVAIVLKGYPRLSETFIAQEILSLQQRGLDYQLVSLRHPTDARRHPVNGEISAPVNYLPEYLMREPRRVFQAWWSVRKTANYKKVRACWIADLKRDFTASRLRRFGQAIVLAHELPPHINWIYAHFLHTPASVARYAANLRGLPWSCSAHAKDIWTSPGWDLAEKIVDMAWLVTCTQTNADHLRTLAAGQSDKIVLLYHGIDLTRFPVPNQPEKFVESSAPSGPVRILSVGRAVEKKGYGTLLDALAMLPEDLNWRLDHIGGGALLNGLKARAVTLGLQEKINWLGARSQDEVLQYYRQSDIFVLASRIADDGDRDGLPNVLMEAQSQGLACLSTRVSAVPELIIDNETGILVEPEEPQALSAALRRLIIDLPLRQRLGRAGAERVHDSFSHLSTIGILARRFGLDASVAAAE